MDKPSIDVFEKPWASGNAPGPIAILLQSSQVGDVEMVPDNVKLTSLRVMASQRRARGQKFAIRTIDGKTWIARLA